MNVRMLTVISAVLALLLAACAPPSTGGGDGSGGGGTTGQDGRTQVRWLQWWATEKGWDKLKVVENAFEAEHPDIDLVIEDVPSTQAHDKFVTLALAGQSPDVITISAIWLTEFAKADMVVPIDDYLAKEPAEYLEHLDTPMLTNYDGKYWGVPVTNGPVGMYYNKDILEKAGVEVPETWEDLAAAVEPITKSGKHVLTGNMSAEPPYSLTYELFPFVVTAGGHILDESGKAVFNSEQGIEALEFVGELYNTKGAVTPGAANATETQKRENFISGNTALMFESHAGISVIATGNPDLNYGVAPMPMHATRGTILQGTSIGVSEQSKVKDAAWEFVSWMGSDDGATLWSEQTNFFPGNTVAMKAPHIQKNAGLQVFSTMFADDYALETVDGRLPNAANLRKELTEQVQQYLDGTITAKQALDAAADSWNAEIAKG